MSRWLVLGTKWRFKRWWGARWGTMSLGSIFCPVLCSDSGLTVSIVQSTVLYQTSQTLQRTLVWPVQAVINKDLGCLYRFCSDGNTALENVTLALSSRRCRSFAAS